MDCSWIDFGGTFNEFKRRELVTPGLVLVVAEHGSERQYLVGDINELGGVCDDCTAFAGSAMVLRYCRVFLPSNQ